MRQREIAGGEQREEALARLLEDVHLAEGGDAVDAGIGARIRREHHALIEQDADAIGHESSLLSLLLLLAWKLTVHRHGLDPAAAAHASYRAGLSIVETDGGADIGTPSRRRGWWDRSHPAEIVNKGLGPGMARGMRLVDVR